MSSFITTWYPRLSVTGSRNSAFIAQRQTRPNCLLLRPKRKAPASLCTMQTSSATRVFRVAAEAAIEDFLTTGMNVYIGGGNTKHLTEIMNSIATTLDADQIVDVAFVCSSRIAREMCEQRDLPSDLSVNLTQTIDLFIAPAEHVDDGCNVIIESDAIASDCYAAEIAEKIVVVVNEDDAQKLSGNISIAVQLVDFLPDEAVKQLCSVYMLELGVRGVTLRDDGSFIADVSVSSEAHLKVVGDELGRLPCVLAVGLLAASAKMTAVVATSDMLPFDMTSSLQCMADLPAEKRSKALEGGKLEQMIGERASEWEVVGEEQGDSLAKEFVFTNAESAEAFVRYVHYMSRSIGHHPVIEHVYNRVTISLSLGTVEAKVVTELDLMCARELSSVYRRMRCNVLRKSM